MKKDRLLCIGMILCLCMCFMQPVLAEDTTEDDGDWIYIHYMTEGGDTVKIHPGYAIANLWEPETIHGSKFWYWTTRTSDPFNEAYRITKSTVFYKNTFLYPVTEHTEEDMKEMQEFAEAWDPGGTTQQETEEPRTYFEVHFHMDGVEEDWYEAFEKPVVLGKEIYEDYISEVQDRKGYRFMGFYTKPNGKGKKMGPKTKIKSDMDFYAYWVDDGCYTVEFMKNYGHWDQLLGEIDFDEKHPVMIKTLKATRKHYQFLGWYTEPKGGTRIREGAKLTQDLTLYAHWKKINVPRASIRKLDSKNRSAIVKYKKVKSVTGYQVQISTSKNYAGKKTKMKSYRSNQIFTRKISNLKKGQTYYLRVRAYQRDSAGYKIKGKWSKSKKITIQ